MLDFRVVSICASCRPEAGTAAVRASLGGDRRQRRSPVAPYSTEWSIVVLLGTLSTGRLFIGLSLQNAQASHGCFVLRVDPKRLL